MKKTATKAMGKAMRMTALAAGLAMLLTLAAPVPAYAKKKKEEAAPKQPPSLIETLDYSKIVWPNPPAVTRIKYLNYF